MVKKDFSFNASLDDDVVDHLVSSGLKMPGSNGKSMVPLYRFVGGTGGRAWAGVRDYFVYVNPEFVLRNGVTGFRDYGDIGWYCRRKDVFIVEERLGVPLHLTVGYRERIRRSEAGEWYDRLVDGERSRRDLVAEIKGWFTEAVYPREVRDYVGDVVGSSHVYLPDREFFEEGGVCFLIREDQDFIGMFVNLEFSKRLGNARGFLDGIFCYLDFDPELADLINDVCFDETEEFRRMMEERSHYVYQHDPCHGCGFKDRSKKSGWSKKCKCYGKGHEFHSGCTQKKDKKRFGPYHHEHY